MGRFSGNDGLPEDPRLLRARGQVGDSAVALHVLAMAHASRIASDGRVAGELLGRFTLHKRPEVVASALVEAGLWGRVEGGYQLLDFFDTNESQEKRELRRERDRVRQAKARLKQNDADIAVASRRDSAVTDSASRRDSSPVTAESRRDNAPARQAKLPLEGLVPKELPAPEPEAATVAEAEVESVEMKRHRAFLRYAAAYSAGIESVTGRPHSFPDTKEERQALGRAINTYAKGLKLDILDAWLTEKAKEYARSALSEVKYSRGFAPSKFLEWLVEPFGPSVGRSSAPPKQAAKPGGFASKVKDPETGEMRLMTRQEVEDARRRVAAKGDVA